MKQIWTVLSLLTLLVNLANCLFANVFNELKAFEFNVTANNIDVTNQFNIYDSNCSSMDKIWTGKPVDNTLKLEVYPGRYNDNKHNMRFDLKIIFQSTRPDFDSYEIVLAGNDSFKTCLMLKSNQKVNKYNTTFQMRIIDPKIFSSAARYIFYFGRIRIIAFNAKTRTISDWQNVGFQTQNHPSQFFNIDYNCRRTVIDETCLSSYYDENGGKCAYSIIHTMPSTIGSIRHKFGQYKAFRDDVISYDYEGRQNFVFKIVPYNCNDSTEFYYADFFDAPSNSNICSENKVKFCSCNNTCIECENRPDSPVMRIRNADKKNNIKNRFCERPGFAPFKEILQLKPSDTILSGSTLHSEKISLVDNFGAPCIRLKKSTIEIHLIDIYNLQANKNLDVQYQLRISTVCEHAQNETQKKTTKYFDLRANNIIEIEKPSIGDYRMEIRPIVESLYCQKNACPGLIQIGLQSEIVCEPCGLLYFDFTVPTDNINQYLCLNRTQARTSTDCDKTSVLDLYQQAKNEYNDFYYVMLVVLIVIIPVLLIKHDKTEIIIFVAAKDEIVRQKNLENFKSFCRFLPGNIWFVDFENENKEERMSRYKRARAIFYSSPDDEHQTSDGLCLIGQNLYDEEQNEILKRTDNSVKRFRSRKELLLIYFKSKFVLSFNRSR